MANHEIMMDNRGETQSQEVYKRPSFFKRKAAALAVTGAMLFGGAGCADRMATTDTSGDITPTSTSENVTTNGTTSLSTSEVIVTPEDTSGTKVTANTEATDPKVTVKPATTVGTSAETQYVTQTPTETPIATTPTPEVSNNEDLLNKAMDIEGLTKEVQGENVIYKENGEIVAMYNPNIYINGEKVGGYALPENDVNKLMTKKLAEIPEGKPKLEVTIPVDITKITSEDKLNIYDSVCTTVNNTSVIGISSEKPMILINVASDDGEFFTGSNELSFLENGETVEVKTLTVFPMVCTNEYSSDKANDSLFYFVDDKANPPAEKTYKIGEDTEVESTFIKICSNRSVPTSITTKSLFTTNTGEIVTVYPTVTETNN